MVVAGDNEKRFIIGLTEADIEDMRNGLTKTKQGGPDWGFRQIIVFMGQDDASIKKFLMRPGTKDQDDLFPNIGSG